MATPDSVRTAITALHQAISDHSDPECKTLLTGALQTVMKVQQKDYAQHADTQTAAQTMQTSMGRNY